MDENKDSIIAGLLENARDSLEHALAHFEQRRGSKRDYSHHDKWIFLSVHHAAECACNAHLISIAGLDPIKDNKGGIRFPSLSPTLKIFKKEQYASILSRSEKRMHELLETLTETRDAYMHRIAPEAPDISAAALCMMGLMKWFEIRHGITPSDVTRSWQSYRVENDVLNAIHFRRMDEYVSFITSFISDCRIDASTCPNCNERGVIGSTCEVCFEELDTIRCHVCEGKIYVTRWQKERGIPQSFECEDCGTKGSYSSLDESQPKPHKQE